MASEWNTKWGRCLVRLAALSMIGGCAGPKAMTGPEPPNVMPTEPAPDRQTLALDSSHVKPMYMTLLAIDLPTVVQLATLENFDIQQARLAVQASRGRLESTVGAVFPALVPTALFEHVEGSVRATPGNITGVGFNTFQPSLAVQWIINPGRVVYDIIASKKRLAASEHRERAVVLETLRRSVVEFYALVLSQADVSAANQSVEEAAELLRINRLRTQAGVGVPADEMRAEARLAGRRQDLVLAMKALYDASVTLGLTLRLESTVTLVPDLDELPPIQLVRDDLDIDELLGIAVTFRPDLEDVRTLVEAVAAETGSTWWGAFGPQFQTTYQYGGITGHSNNTTGGEGVPGNLIVNPASASGSFSSIPIANGLIREGISRGSKQLDSRRDESFSFSDQQRVTAKMGWRFSLSAFGDLKTAKAIEEGARIEAMRRLDEVNADVVRAAQASRAYDQLIDLARHQVTAAEEALRLSEANLQAGTMTTLDVLQAQDAVSQARLRYAASVVRYNQAQVNLLAALGLLNEKTLTASHRSALSSPPPSSITPSSTHL